MREDYFSAPRREGGYQLGRVPLQQLQQLQTIGERIDDVLQRQRIERLVDRQQALTRATGLPTLRLTGALVQRFHRRVDGPLPSLRWFRGRAATESRDRLP